MRDRKNNLECGLRRNRHLSNIKYLEHECNDYDTISTLNIHQVDLPLVEIFAINKDSRGKYSFIESENGISLKTVQFKCPKCNKLKFIKIPAEILKDTDDVKIISIPKGILCQHQIQAFVDNWGIVRGYSTPDYELPIFDKNIHDNIDNSMRKLNKTVQNIKKFQKIPFILNGIHISVDVSEDGDFYLLQFYYKGAESFHFNEKVDKSINFSNLVDLAYMRIFTFDQTNIHKFNKKEKVQFECNRKEFPKERIKDVRKKTKEPIKYVYLYKPVINNEIKIYVS